MFLGFIGVDIPVYASHLIAETIGQALANSSLRATLVDPQRASFDI
jgi:hypothetical protein